MYLSMTMNEEDLTRGAGRGVRGRRGRKKRMIKMMRKGERERRGENTS